MSQEILVADVQSHAPRERAVFRGLARILAHPLGRIGAILVGTVVLLALVAPFITHYDPLAQVLTHRLLPPGPSHVFGTDTLGRDVFARVVFGARPSLTIVLVSLVIIAPFGLFVGAAAGFLGGWISVALMRIGDIFMAFPRLILALATAATLGGGFFTLVISIVVTGWPSYARIARAEAVVIARSDFVQASEILGASRLRLLLVHVLPHCVPAMIVRAALDAPAIVLIAAGLGFLGAGLPPPQPEWGAMVADGRSVIFDAWWISTLPGAFILVLSVGFNLIADALRDIIDPRA